MLEARMRIVETKSWAPLPGLDVSVVAVRFYMSFIVCIPLRLKRIVEDEWRRHWHSRETQPSPDQTRLDPRDPPRSSKHCSAEFVINLMVQNLVFPGKIIDYVRLPVGRIPHFWDNPCRRPNLWSADCCCSAFLNCTCQNLDIKVRRVTGHHLNSRLKLPWVRFAGNLW